MAKKTPSRRPAAGPSRLAGESGHILKPRSGRLAVALCYPNTYAIGMSNLGFQKVYHLLNRREDTVCERFFLPDPPELAHLAKSGGRLASVETGAALNSFDVIAFSVTFELDYANILLMLRLGGISGGASLGGPLIMAGGIAVTMNPEAMADHFDLALLGEAEGILDPLIDGIHKLKTGVSHVETYGPDRLQNLAGLPGVYVTCGYEPLYAADGSFSGIRPKPGYPVKVRRVWSKSAMDDPNFTRIHTEDTVFGGMGLVETGKGCGRHCRFCAAGYSYRPTRITEKAAMLKAVDGELDKRGRVGLVGSAVSDHPDLMETLEHIVGRKGEFAISSMRLDRMDERFLNLCWKGGIRTITAAPEAGSARMRRVINKELDREKIIAAAALIGKTANFHLKLYFLAGLPWETDEDAEDICRIVVEMRDAMVEASRARGSAGSIHVSVNGFVPKPWTPFQWAPFAGVKVLQGRFRLIRQGLRGQANITLATGSPHMDHIQAALSLGGRWMGKLAALAARHDGDWIRAAKELPMPQAPHWTPGGPLPWDMVDYGLKDDYLEKDFRRAEREMIIAECPPPGTPCVRCGSFSGVCAEERG